MATEFVGIELQLMGYQGVKSDLEQIDALLRSFRGRKKVDAGMGELRKEIVAARGELEKYIRLREKYLEAGGKGDAYVKEIGEARNKLKDLQQVQREVTASQKAMGQSFKQTFNSMSSRIAHIGSAMQSLGNALTRLSSPFRRFTSGLLMGAGYKALNLFTEGLSNTFTRSDTMRNYDRALSALGLNTKKTFKLMSDEALTAKENLDLAVQGLPTSLDEIMAAQKVYAGATGEMVESTKTAIAANNAFLASTTDSRQQRILQRYFTALSSGANLTAIQWAAMQRNMPLAFRKVAEAMGYMDLAEFQSDLGKSNEKAQEFLKTFQELGTTGVIRDAAMVMTKSWSGLSSNIKIAVTRMGQGVIDTLNEVFEKETGRDLLSHLLGIDANGKEVGGGIKHWINDMSTAVQDWVKAHPEELIDFFETLKNVDWTSLVRGFAEGTLAIAQFVGKLADFAAGKDLSWIGKFMTKAGIWGRGFTILGGVIKGLRHPLALIATVASRLGKTGGLLGLLVKLFGKGKDAKAAESVLGEAPTFASTAKRAFSAIQGVISVAAAIAIGSGAGFIAFKSFKSMMSDLKDIIDIMSDIDWELGAGALTAMGTFFAAFAGLGKFASMNVGNLVEILIGEAGVGLITTLAAGFATLDLYLFKQSMLNLEGAIDALNRSIDKMGEIKNVPGGVVSKVGNTISAINDIIDLFSGNNDPKLGEVKEGLHHFSGTQAKTVENIKTVLDTMVDTAATINEINGITLETGNIETIKGSFNDALQAIGEVFSRDNLPEAFYYGEGAGASTDFASTLRNINSALGVLVGEDGVLAKLRQLASETNVSVSSQMAKGNITEMLNNLKTAFSSLVVNDAGGDYSSVATKMGNFASALENVKTAFERMSEIEKAYGKLGTNGKGGTGNFKATSAINRLISQLQQAFNADKINQLNSQISGFVDTVNSLLDMVNSISADSGNITIEINVKDKISGDTTVISHIKALNDKIRRAVDAIKTDYYKTVKVHINTTTSGATPSANMKHGGVQMAVGGMVYRSHGGSIPFRRRGTDTVPAMLTPGEYVQNRRAVNAFGIDFMRKVNSLDMKGAMNELMHRAGGMANINRGTSITNNYHNNQKVVINNSNNAGAGYTFKSASRFVGAF